MLLYKALSEQDEELTFSTFSTPGVNGGIDIWVKIPAFQQSPRSAENRLNLTLNICRQKKRGKAIHASYVKASRKLSCSHRLFRLCD